MTCCYLRFSFISIGIGMDNVFIQSILIVLVGVGGGIGGAALAFFIARLLGRVKTQDEELDKTKNIKRRIYTVAIEALQGMRAGGVTLDLYKANFRAFRDALTDADVLELESSGIWRAKLLLSTLSSGDQRSLPDDETRRVIMETEQELLKSVSELEDDSASGKKKKKK